MTAADFARRQYDYLIVGGGTAGLVVAARLSEDPSIIVGVLEAGGLPSDIPGVTVPGRFGEAIGTDIDWQYETTPQRELGGRTIPFPRGKVLGGTSALNFMLWNRPCREDLDAWRDLGNSGWGWDDILPFYKRAENFTEPDASHAEQHKLFYDRDVLGKGGPVHVSFMKEYSASHPHWHDTLRNLGVQTNESPLSGSNVGAWTSNVAVDPEKMTRAWSASSYYLPNARRPDLHVLTDATVRNIVLESDGKRLVAKGACFDHADGRFVAAAIHEVVICAGSIASPQILELSGIGNPQVLEKAGIPVKFANNNVGENLQEHIMAAMIYEVDSSTPCAADLLDPALGAAADKMYQDHRTGPRTVLGWSCCYLPFEYIMSEEELASLAAHVETGTTMDGIRARRLTRHQNLGQIEYIFDVGNWSAFMPSEPGKKYATLMQILQYPLSHGCIHVASDNPAEKPLINPQFYEGKHGAVDRDVQERCAEFGERILQTKPLKDFVKKRVWPPEGLSTAGWKDWLIENTVVDWHPVGTCAMGGKGGAKDGVVDDRLKVYGVQRLRVADASIFPLQISAHLQATVYAVGEKASQMILEDRAKGEMARL